MWFVDASYRGTPEALAALAEAERVRITNTVIGSPMDRLAAADQSGQPRPMAGPGEDDTRFHPRANIPAAIVCTGNDVHGMTDAQMLESVIED